VRCIQGMILSLILALTIGCGDMQTDPPEQPNIIFVLADDLGWAELGCYGNTFNETPELDKLASEGMRFTAAYAAAPVCSPFRVSLMAGQYPVREGITDYLRPDDSKHLSTDHTTIAEALQQAGYATGMVGKWHLTGYKNHGAEEFPPAVHGFDEAMVSENRGIGGGSYFHPYHFNKEIEQRLPGKEFLVDRCNLEAVEFIERNQDGPFFLYLSHYAVHTWLLGKPDLVAKYEAKPGGGKGEKASRNNPHLAAQLESIDTGVGMIRQKLAELNIADNTIIIFMSDNGGQHSPNPKHDVTTNAPLRGGKSELYDGGIREPLIVYWPGMVEGGTVCNEPVNSVDFYPTILDMAGATPDANQLLDGMSLQPLLTQTGAIEERAMYWHYPLAKPHFLGGFSAGAVRQGPYKLIEFYDSGKLELYNIADDISETTNLIGRNPELGAKLHSLLKAWRNEVGAKKTVD
jgi:arylsulfatase A